MQMQIYHLQARSPFHLGMQGIGLEATSVTAQADTIFSALCSMYRQWQGSAQLAAFLERFISDPPFLLSSGFPYVSVGGERLSLFPRPKGMPTPYQQDMPEVHKAVKKVKFISETLFRLWINGDPDLLLEMADLGDEQNGLLQDGQVWVTRTEAEIIQQNLPLDMDGNPRLYHEGDVPRVTVDRIDNRSAVFQAGRVWFAPEGGLWIGIIWREENDALRQDLAELLTMLGDAGLGGERSIGHGQFTVAGEDVIELPDPGSRFVTLSPLWPHSQDEAAALIGERVAYELIWRRGWIGSPEGRALKRKAVRMLAEGSVLEAPTSDLIGGLADVTPGEMYHRQDHHPVYRYGYAFPVGVK